MREHWLEVVCDKGINLLKLHPCATLELNIKMRSCLPEVEFHTSSVQVQSLHALCMLRGHSSLALAPCKSYTFVKHIILLNPHLKS
jgi:hypothetical protein